MNFARLTYRKFTRIVDDGHWDALDAGDRKQIIVDVIDITLVLIVVAVLPALAMPFVAVAMVLAIQYMSDFLGLWTLITGASVTAVISLIGLRCWLSRRIQMDRRGDAQ